MDMHSLAQALAIVALATLAFIYYDRLDRLHTRTHGKRLIRVHLTLGLLTLLGILALVGGDESSPAELVLVGLTLIVSGGYVLLTWREWRGREVPASVHSTMAARLESLFPG